MVESKSEAQAKVNQALWSDGTPKDAKVSQSASKASKPASKAKVASKATGLVQVPLFPKGSAIKAKCQVLIKASGKQCSNPANYPFQSHTTCHTHLNRLVQMTPAGLAKVRFAKVAVAYDPTLWGGPATPPTPASKPASKPRVTKVNSKPATPATPPPAGETAL